MTLHDFQFVTAKICRALYHRARIARSQKIESLSKVVSTIRLLPRYFQRNFSQLFYPHPDYVIFNAKVITTYNYYKNL